MTTSPKSKDRIKKAILECLKQVEKAPKDRRLRLKLGDLYLKNGEKEKAVNEYLMAGDLHAEEDLIARAITIYKKVVSIDPKNIAAIQTMGRLYLKEGFLEDARGCYEKILKIKPKDQEAIMVLSVIERIKQSEQGQAEAQEEVSTEEEPDLSAIRFPILSDSLKDDLPLQLCLCPYCRRSYWIIARSEYYFTCHCGGVSIFDGLTMRAATAAEYEFIRDMERTKTAKTVGSA